MARRLVLAFALLALALSQEALAGWGTGQRPAKWRGRRVRKELRNLTPWEYKLYVRGVSTMLAVPTSAGRLLFGPKYRDYDTLILRHAVAVPDYRGDQGHFVPCFMSFHRAFMMEFENSLLSVVPELGAMPYWDFLLDAPGGKFYQTPRWIFTDLYAGSAPGNSAANYSVTDGVFGWRRVPLWNDLRFAEYKQFYNGSQAGFLRGLKSKVTNPYLLRYPTQDLYTIFGLNQNPLPEPWATVAKVAPQLVTGLVEAIQTNRLPKFTKQDFENPLVAQAFNTWNRWSYGIDVEFAAKAYNTSESLQYVVGLSGLMHGMLHALISGNSLAAGGAYGDMGDIITSPNDVFLFMPMHANLDRNSLMWAANMQAINGSVARNDVMWYYPKSKQEDPGAPSGCLLHDVINSNAKFTDLFDGPPKPSGITHFDLLDGTRPTNSPYTYDEIWGALPMYVNRGRFVGGKKK